jgi:hypothetical protein
MKLCFGCRKGPNYPNFENITVPLITKSGVVVSVVYFIKNRRKIFLGRGAQNKMVPFFTYKYNTRVTYTPLYWSEMRIIMTLSGRCEID